MEELKPCPFCGGKAKMMYAYRGYDEMMYAYQCWARCKKCGAEMAGAMLKSNAIKRWNRRVEVRDEQG